MESDNQDYVVSLVTGIHTGLVATMDNYDDTDTFVNRDDSVPVLVIDHHIDGTSDAESVSSDRSRKRDKFKRKSLDLRDTLKKAQGKAVDGGSSIQDRLLEKYAILKQIYYIGLT